MTSVDPKWGDAIKDDVEDTSQVKPGADGDGFWLLCSYVRSMGQAGFGAKVASGEIKPANLMSTVGSAPLTKDPTGHRLQPVRLRLAPALSTFKNEPTLFENAGQVTSVMLGYAQDDQQRTVWLLSPFPEEAFPSLSSRIVIVEGYFYKRMAVTTAKGKKYWMPVVVVARISPFGGPATATTDFVTIAAYIVLGSLPILGGLALFFVMRNRRERAFILARQRERLAERTAAERTAVERAAPESVDGPRPADSNGSGAGP